MLATVASAGSVNQRRSHALSPVARPRAIGAGIGPNASSCAGASSPPNRVELFITTFTVTATSDAVVCPVTRSTSVSAMIWLTVLDSGSPPAYLARAWASNAAQQAATCSAGKCPVKSPIDVAPSMRPDTQR